MSLLVRARDAIKGYDSTGYVGQMTFIILCLEHTLYAANDRFYITVGLKFSVKVSQA